MKRITLLVTLVVLLTLPLPASADDSSRSVFDVQSHSLAGGAECGTREHDGVANMTKGRTDGLVYSVDHQVGCARVIYRGLSPAGHGEMQGNAGQEARCIRYGQTDAGNVFRYYFHVEVDPASIPVACSNYEGPD